MRRCIHKIIGIGFLFAMLSACNQQKSQQDMDTLYRHISGVWVSDLAGSGVLYLISDAEFHMYSQTYPYPVEDGQEDIGLFSIDRDQQTITFVNQYTGASTTSRFQLSDDFNTLILDDVTYKRTIDTVSMSESMKGRLRTGILHDTSKIVR